MNDYLKVLIGAAMIAFGYWCFAGAPVQSVAFFGGMIIAVTGAILAVKSARNVRDRLVQ